jgi:hypothetical protein
LFTCDENGVPVPLGGTLTHALGSYFESDFYDDPVHPYMRHLDPRPIVASTDADFDDQQFAASGAYSSFYRRLDIRYMASVWPTGRHYGTHGMVGLMLCRSAAQGPFTANDHALLLAEHP